MLTIGVVDLPRFQGPLGELAGRLTALQAGLRKLDQLIKMRSVIGLEKEICSYLLSTGEIDRYSSDRFVRIINEGPSEIITLRLLRSFGSDRQLGEVLKEASLITGGGGKLRQIDIVCAPDIYQRRLKYISPFKMEASIKRLEARRSSAGSGSGLVSAILRYMHFLYIHPFKDGNGRVAKSLLSADVISSCNLNVLTPCFAPRLIVKHQQFACLSIDWIIGESGKGVFDLIITAMEETLVDMFTVLNLCGRDVRC